MPRLGASVHGAEKRRPLLHQAGPSPAGAQGLRMSLSLMQRLSLHPGTRGSRMLSVTAQFKQTEPTSSCENETPTAKEAGEATDLRGSWGCSLQPGGK